MRPNSCTTVANTSEFIVQRQTGGSGLWRRVREAGPTLKEDFVSLLWGHFHDPLFDSFEVQTLQVIEPCLTDPEVMANIDAKAGDYATEAANTATNTGKKWLILSLPSPRSVSP